MVRAAALGDKRRPGIWSIGAFLLAVGGLAAATATIFSTQDNPESVEWWFVVLPLPITGVPLLVPQRAVRIVAGVLLTVWCLLATFSIGYLLWPALIAMVVAAAKEPS